MDLRLKDKKSNKGLDDWVRQILRERTHHLTRQHQILGKKSQH